MKSENTTQIPNVIPINIDNLTNFTKVELLWSTLRSITCIRVEI